MTAALLRPVRTEDTEAVLRLNEEHVPLVSTMDADRMARLQEWCDRALVVEADGEVAGFVVTFGPGSPYDSENYRWFAQRYDRDCYYLDRIVIDPRFRRRGLASLVYDEAERLAAPYGRLALEVNSRPANEPSLAFHAGRGFVPVGERTYADGTAVSMMVKELAGR